MISSSQEKAEELNGNNNEKPVSIARTMRRLSIPPEILNHIFSYVLVDILDEEMIRKVCALREGGSDFVQTIAESVRQLNVGCLLGEFNQRKWENHSLYLCEHIWKIAHIFPKLERLNLDGLVTLRDDQLEYLLDRLDLKEISLVDCGLITQFKCRDISQFESVKTDGYNVVLRAALYRQIAFAVYDRKPRTLVRTPNDTHTFVKSLIGNIVELHLCKKDTISDIKTLYEGMTGIYANHQRMIWAGKRLSDDRLLSEYGNMGSEITIHVVFRLSEKTQSTAVQRPIYNQIEFKTNEDLKHTTLYEHDDFKVLELDLLNSTTCRIFTEDILYEKQDNRDYNITTHLSNPFKKYLNTTVIPYLNKLCEFDRKIQEVHDIFVVHYAPEEDQDLVLHIDPSFVTLNICVHTSETFRGNEIEFVTQQELDASKLVSECGCGSEMDETQYTYKRVTPTVGNALVHLGSHPHRTLKIVDGKRFNVVCWLK